MTGPFADQAWRFGNSREVILCLVTQAEKRPDLVWGSCLLAPRAEADVSHRSSELRPLSGVIVDRPPAGAPPHPLPQSATFPVTPQQSRTPPAA